MTLSEFVEKKGDQNWVDPLLEEVGPWLMIQLADLANLMETLRKLVGPATTSQSIYRSLTSVASTNGGSQAKLQKLLGSLQLDFF